MLEPTNYETDYRKHKVVARSLLIRDSIANNRFLLRRRAASMRLARNARFRNIWPLNNRNDCIWSMHTSAFLLSLSSTIFSEYYSTKVSVVFTIITLR